MITNLHGWGVSQRMATERFDRAKMSLNNNSYYMPVVGFSWDSNTRAQPDHAGWTVANLIAKENDPKLANFFFDFMNKCANSTSHSKVRIIAHSLGSRFALSALDSLHNNKDWTNKNFKVYSVHLLGAAVDEVVKFYNLFNAKDKVLSGIYSSVEHDNALGLKGKQIGWRW